MMAIELVDIIHKPEWERAHQIRAIEIDGRCRVAVELADLARYDAADFAKIMKVVRMVAEQERVTNTNHVKRGRGYPDIYEMRAHRGHARLYFFYTPAHKEVVVCTNSYWKTKPSANEENEAFQRVDRLRQRYLESLPQWKGRK